MTNEINFRADGSIDQTIMDLGKDWLAVEIAANAMTFAESLVELDTESGGASDDLETIANGGTGKMLLLKIADAGRVVTLRHDAGNLWLMTHADRVLDDPNEVVMLVYNGSYWVGLGKASAGALVITAAFSWAPDGLTVQFTDLSTVSAGTIVDWYYDFGDGDDATSQHPSHVFPADGAYSVTLTVEDALGNTDSATVLVWVAADAWYFEIDFADTDAYSFTIGGNLNLWQIGSGDTIPVGLGVYVPGTGYTEESTLGLPSNGVDVSFYSLSVSQGWRGVTLRIPFPAAAKLRLVLLYGTQSHGTFSPTSLPAVRGAGFLAGLWQYYASSIPGSSFTASDFSGFMMNTTLGLAIDEIAFWLLSSADNSSPYGFSGNLTARGIALRGGASANPFGANNVSNHLAFVQQPTSGPEDTSISPSITVEARDTFGRKAGDVTTQITLSLGANPGGATLGGTLTRTCSGGVATFNNITVSDPAAGYTLVAEATAINPVQNDFGFVGVESDPFTIT